MNASIYFGALAVVLVMSVVVVLYDAPIRGFLRERWPRADVGVDSSNLLLGAVVFFDVVALSMLVGSALALR